MIKYFEYTRRENYLYALIKAESKKQADFIYWRDVVKCEEEFARTGLITEFNAVELTEKKALKLFMSSLQEYETEEEIKQGFYETVNNKILLLDSDLI
ncbi:hypothetical protein AJL09_04210 [Listeria monocytogenes]|uniref:Lin1256 protein n=1 Tax=Listeria innocua serovar 6a (strain ATCC BAA-680 / CLIP 11262) TaxID=272626 RepID=Q92CD1_LISIN|nr:MULTISPECIES: hypothetical protein [Listeria]YP_001468770.1 gp66 [Listeria phage B054]AAY53171.1 gp66 [Listeria phage B054]EAC4403245.1 hypothetical protein [Listeria monocytogenes]EAC6434237.1 hypothetical protein [Listeria monocytogenes]EAC6481369.1 hypothetical protein [Listeria monocytogenes]EAC6497682.1 hypothetical protein [Listeria monocytogenes]